MAEPGPPSWFSPSQIREAAGAPLYSRAGGATVIPMVIELINTGSELMLGHVLNTHQQWICRELSNLGHTVARQVAVDDGAVAIQAAVHDALERADLIVVTGGLGPTSDDRTRDLVAGMFGRKLLPDPAIAGRIREFFATRRRPMPESVLIQAMVPEGAVVFENRHGTAPGLAMKTPRGWLVMLPGPPRELRPMLAQQVLPFLQEQFPPPEDFACEVIRTTGVGESWVEEKVAGPLAPLLGGGLQLGYCARNGEVDVRLVARGPGARDQVLAAAEIVRNAVGGPVYGRHPETLEGVVVALMAAKGLRLATAESCTGGFLAHRVTNVPGASAVLLAGWVAYANEAKTAALGVPAEIWRAHGAVSAETARAMAEGARERAGADYALSTTGIAGPGGGTPEKPVGTVFIGLSGPGGTRVLRRRNDYDRETFKLVSTQQALDLLRRAVAGLPPE